jgi:hypothetical protein
MSSFPTNGAELYGRHLIWQVSNRACQHFACYIDVGKDIRRYLIMSGVEVAGFVLAAFPLLISALEDYRQGWEILEDWWKIKREYKKCQQNLKIQKLVFEENLEQLLSTLVQDDEELKLLIAKPGGDLWQDAELESGLKERLPKSYEVYLEIIGEIMAVMKSLKKELGVDVHAFQSRIEEVSLVIYLDISHFVDFFPPKTRSLHIIYQLESYADGCMLGLGPVRCEHFHIIRPGTGSLSCDPRKLIS